MIRNHFARRFLLCSDGSPRYREPVVKTPILRRCAAIDGAHPSQRRQIITLSANSRQKVGPSIPRYASKEASNPAHQLGSCVDLATVHEDSASFFVCLGELITSDCHTR